MPLREGVRVLLLDDQNRLLMIKVQDSGIVVADEPVPDTFWTTVGGGLAAGESYEHAAQREVFEETGIDNFCLGQWIWDRERIANWQGELRRVYERYYLARTLGTLVTFEHSLDAERQVFREARWWSVEDMASATDETFVPQGLPTLLASALEAPPTLTIHL
jgi:8-oxo-dGTP pyrophosphatase MutT (NUDIX family)